MKIGKDPGGPHRMEPLWPTVADDSLRALAIRVIRLSAKLGEALHPLTRRHVAELLQSMNSYYSNLIEGHKTHPADIERALRSELAADPARRALQLESRAHVEVQRLLEKRLSEEPDLKICSAGFLSWIHSEFYGRMPEEFCRVQDRRGNQLPVEAGTLRDREVEVGEHLAPPARSLQGLLDRFGEAYEPSQLNEVDQLVAAGASHHRLTWIHPFLDGNGRVARLFSHAYLIRAGVDGSGLWAISRGLARRRQEYFSALRDADHPRRGDLDGRGNLSNEGLVSFVRFFLGIASDQIAFMSGLLELEGLERRIRGYLEVLSSSGELKAGAFYLLRE